MKFISVFTTQEMTDSVMQLMKDQDIFISAAAVSDFHYAQYSNQKIKKPKNIDTILFEFKCNPDIVTNVKRNYSSVFCVGFSLETENLIENAIKKLKTKSLDLIIANLVNSDYGIAHEDNAVSVIDKSLKITDFEKENKNSLAIKLILYVAEKFHLFKRISS